MLNYMKYEIKGTYKFIMGILALVLILITGLYFYTTSPSSGREFFTVMSVFILFGTALTAFLYIVGSFRKELYEDRGYLTFTLPLTGSQIVGSKLIVAMLWFTVLGVAFLSYNFLMMLSFSPAEINLSDVIAEVFRNISFAGIVSVAFSSILSGVSMLVMIYFSMALSRVTFRNKKIGSLWFVLFLFLSGVISFVQFEIAQMLPYYIDFNTFEVGTLEDISTFHLGFGTVGSTNIATLIYQLVVIIALFFGTGYLIEKKIDL